VSKGLTFLINRSDAIGDTILTTPMAKLIKAHYPESKVVYLVSQRVGDLLKEHPYIDEFKIYHRHKKFFYKMREVYKIFREIKPTHYFFVGGGFFPNFMSFVTGVKFRGGLKSRWHTYLFLNYGVRQKRSLVTMHEMEYNLNLLAPLGIHYTHHEYQNLIPELKTTLEEDQKNIELLNTELIKNSLDVNKKYIIIHPGMTGHTLNWSSRNYGRLITRLEEKFPDRFNYLISHTASDAPFLIGLKEILSYPEHQHLKSKIYFYDGKNFGLRAFISIAKNAALFVGASTGTTHIASVSGTPVVGIYSPIKVQSRLRWGPVGADQSKIRVVVPDVICGEHKKCALRACPYYECMGRIEVEDVVREANSIINF
jgi:ADP-heptose:LPS heptosyltransferase